jgi:hypothetical protein
LLRRERAKAEALAYLEEIRRLKRVLKECGGDKTYLSG